MEINSIWINKPEDKKKVGFCSESESDFHSEIYVEKGDLKISTKLSKESISKINTIIINEINKNIHD